MYSYHERGQFLLVSMIIAVLFILVYKWGGDIVEQKVRQIETQSYNQVYQVIDDNFGISVQKGSQTKIENQTYEQISKIMNENF